MLLKREGWEVNAKRIYRLYTEESLIVRTKKRKQRAQRQRIAQGIALRSNQRWSMDFVAQRLADGLWVRVQTVVDQFTRECLCLHADTTLSGEKGAAALDKVVALRGTPESFTATTEPSSARRRWITGLTRTVCTWTSSVQAGLSKTATSRASTVGCATSA